jgi:hypothetical protein
MSCLFNAIGQRLNKSGTDVRQEICKYLEENHNTEINDLKVKEWIEIGEEVPFAEYVNAMKQPRTWGGAVECFSASIIYNIAIVILYNGRKIRICSNENNNQTEIELHYNGSHYQ